MLRVYLILMFVVRSVQPRGNVELVKETQQLDEPTRNRLLRMYGAHQVSATWPQEQMILTTDKLCNGAERHGEPSPLDRRGRELAPMKYSNSIT